MTLTRPLQVTEEGAEVAAADQFAAYDTDGSGVSMRVPRRCGGVRALRALARETSMLQPQSCIYVCLYVYIYIYIYSYIYIYVFPYVSVIKTQNFLLKNRISLNFMVESP